MRLRFSIIAIGALCCLFSGCGCSKEKKAEDGIPARMEDAAYTNRLVEVHKSRNAVAAKAAAIREKIAKLGSEAQGTPAFIDLTNQLSQCEAESDQMRKTALNVIRTRVMKESSQKGNLKK